MEEVALCYGVAGALAKTWPRHARALEAVLARVTGHDTKLRDMEDWATAYQAEEKQAREARTSAQRKVLERALYVYDSFDRKSTEAATALGRIRRILEEGLRELDDCL